MRNKLLFFLLSVTALVFSLSSCQREEKLSGDGTPQDVTISVAAPYTSLVKSNENPGAGDMINRCILEIYEDGVLYGERQAVDFAGSAAFKANLIAGHTYDFVFWADYAEGNAADGFQDVNYNTADGLTAITVITDGYLNNDDTRDAFYGSYPVTIESGKTYDYKLTRPFGRVQMFTTDIQSTEADLTGAVVKVSYAKVPAGFNALSKTVSSEHIDLIPGQAAGIFEIPAAGATEAQLSYDYIFASENNGETLVQFTLNVEANGQTLCPDFSTDNIPVRQNYRTNVRGNFLTQSGEDVDITVGTDPEFGEDDIEKEIIAENLALESCESTEPTTDGVTISYSYTYDGEGTVTESGVGYRVKGTEAEYEYVAYEATRSTESATVTLTGLESGTEYEYVCYFVLEGSEDKYESTPRYFTTTEDTGEPEPGELVEATIGEFIAAETSTTIWYKLTGTITKIENSTYGNIVIEDETGSVLIYGLTKSGPLSDNDKSFGSIGLNVGDIVTLATVRGEFNGEAQGGGQDTPAYYISHEEGEEPEPVEPVIATVAQVLAADVDDNVWYQLTGTITDLYNSEYGNFTLVDESGSILVYGLTAEKVSSNDKSFSTLGLKEGDIVTLVGTRDEYGGEPQIGGPAYYISHEEGEEPEPVEPVIATVEQVLTAAVNDNVWYQLTGTISDISNTTYGNFDLTDETGTIYVYGLTAEKVSSNDKSFSTLGLKEGDIVTLVGTRDEFGGDPQIGGPAYYISHEAGQGGEEPEPNVITGTQGDGVYSSTVDLTQPSVNENDDKWYNFTFNIDGNPYPAVKIGSSSDSGAYSFYLGKTGSCTLSMYAIAWNGKKTNAKVMISGGGTVNGLSYVELDCQTNSALAGNATTLDITFGTNDFFTMNIEGATENTVITVTTDGFSNKRIAFTGVNVK